MTDLTNVTEFSIDTINATVTNDDIASEILNGIAQSNPIGLGPILVEESNIALGTNMHASVSNDAGTNWFFNQFSQGGTVTNFSYFGSVLFFCRYSYYNWGALQYSPDFGYTWYDIDSMVILEQYNM